MTARELLIENHSHISPGHTLEQLTAADAALHNSHHLGQVILLRQLMALWPPPAGSFTW